MSYGNEFEETLHPGILITSKVSPNGGTLGCFARMADDASKVVMLSNSHVLYGDIASLGGSGNGAEVGQPSVSCCLCCTCRVVAKNSDNAFTEVTVDITSPSPDTQTGSEIDCAIALLNDKRAYTNETLYGMITGTPSSGLGVSANDPVEMVGSTTGPSKGKVLGLATVATYQGTSTSIPDILYPYRMQGTDFDEDDAGVFPSINQMLILPDPDPDHPDRPMHFCGHGDSGSVIVNASKQVVGMISRAWPLSDTGRTRLNTRLQSPLPPHAGTLGIASPIEPVLRVLKIDIANNMSGTMPSAGNSLIEFRQADAERRREAALQLTLRDLEREIRGKVLGREAMSALDRNREEVLQLVNTKRQVTVVWHRNQGPAFAAHCLHSISDHKYLIPEDVHGVSPALLLQKMSAVLKRFGSPQLQTDIETYEQLALDWVEDCTSLWQLVDRMRRLESVPVEPLIGTHGDAA